MSCSASCKIWDACHHLNHGDQPHCAAIREESPANSVELAQPKICADCAEGSAIEQTMLRLRWINFCPACGRKLRAGA